MDDVLSYAADTKSGWLLYTWLCNKERIIIYNANETFKKKKK